MSTHKCVSPLDENNKAVIREEHCFHRGMTTYTSIPPQWDEQCCFCGMTRRVYGTMPQQPIGHGPYAPIE